MRSVIATTNVDKTGEKFSKETLQKMVDTFNKGGVPVLANFNIKTKKRPDIQGSKTAIECN